MMALSKLIAINQTHTLAISRVRSLEEEIAEIIAVFPTEFADKIEFDSIYREGQRRLVMYLYLEGEELPRRYLNPGNAAIEIRSGKLLPDGKFAHHTQGQAWNMPDQLEVVDSSNHPKGRGYHGSIFSGLSDLLGYNDRQVDLIYKNKDFLTKRFPDARYIKYVGDVCLEDYDLESCPNWMNAVEVLY
jgi:hypothetical protein